MTIAALRRLLDEELPHVPRRPAPRLPRQHFTAKETTMHTTTPPQPTDTAPVAPAGDTPLPVGKLLAWADAHPDPEIQDQGARARVTLAGLRARHTADTELTAITTEAEQLETRLAELRSREAELRPARKTKRQAAERDHDPAIVRAWARQHGVECNPIGRVPRTVVDQWRAAVEPQPQPLHAAS